MTTYIVKLHRLGRSFTVEVWASSTHDARRKAQVAYPGADIRSAEIRKAF